MSTKNSSKIISAIEDNYDKFTTIDKLYRDYLKARKDKTEVLKELQKRYSILKDISGRRIFIGKIGNTASSTWCYFISPNGITKANSPSIQNQHFKDLGGDIGIEISEELYEVSNLPGIKKHIKKREAKTKFEKFFKHRVLLKNEPSTIIVLKKPMTIRIPSMGQPSQIKTIQRIDMKMEDNRRAILQFFSEYGRLETTINLEYFGYSEGLKDKVYIEQMYNQIRTLLEKEVKSKNLEVNKIKQFLAKLKEELPEYFMLEAIENANTK